MSFYKSKNPALGENTFKNLANTAEGTETMTIQGTVNKTAILGIIVLAAASITWQMVSSGDVSNLYPLLIAGLISSFVAAIIIIFNKKTAAYLAPLYCIAQGLVLGAISAIMEMMYSGIVLQAVILTLGILFSLLFLYRTRIIKATENFKLIVASATMGIGVFYLIAIIGRMFGFQMPLIHDNDMWGIIFSLAVVVIAALNLVIDFDFIEQGEAVGAPKYMEWYGAFGLMVTIIWLYIEILRLLSKLRSRD